MQITVNGNLCEIKPIWSEMKNNKCAGKKECIITIKCYANKPFASYEKEKICDVVETLMRQEG